MSESDLWDRLRNGMTGRWDAQRHEDKYSKGIPDVSYGIRDKADGWLELKYIEKLPRNDGPWDFKLSHFTSDQRNWMTSRTARSTAHVFLLCEFQGLGTVLWNWVTLEPLLGKGTLMAIMLHAQANWSGKSINYDQLAHALTVGGRGAILGPLTHR